MKDNIKEKLRALKKDISKKILQDIFGSESKAGLVGCKIIEEFDKQAKSLLAEWRALGEEVAKFADYFGKFKLVNLSLIHI